MLWWEDPTLLLEIVLGAVLIVSVIVLILYENSEDEKLYDQILVSYPDLFKTPTERILLLVAIRRWTRRIVLKLIKA